MKHHIDLTDEETAVLSEALRKLLSDLSYEIANTDLQSFRDELKRKRDVLQKVEASLTSSEGD